LKYSKKITLIADQEILLLGSAVNIHDIETIEIDTHGRIISYVSKSKKIWEGEK